MKQSYQDFRVLVQGRASGLCRHEWKGNTRFETPCKKTPAATHMWLSLKDEEQVDGLTLTTVDETHSHTCFHITQPPTPLFTGYDTHVTVPQGRGTGGWADIDNCWWNTPSHSLPHHPPIKTHPLSLSFNPQKKLSTSMPKCETPTFLFKGCVVGTLSADSLTEAHKSVFWRANLFCSPFTRQCVIHQKASQESSTMPPPPSSQSKQWEFDVFLWCRHDYVMVTPQISLQKTQTILKTILHNQFSVFLLTKKPLSIVDCSFFFKHFFLPSMMQMIRRILLHKHQEGHTQMRFLLTKTLICLQLSFCHLESKARVIVSHSLVLSMVMTIPSKT